MDKYGVITEEAKAKTAADHRLCHYCSTILDMEANVPKCRVCGTKPFEYSTEPLKKERGEDGNV